MIGYETKLWFGKYKGKRVNSIIATDPAYIFWLHYNTETVVSKKALGAAKVVLDALKARDGLVLVKKPVPYAARNQSKTTHQQEVIASSFIRFVESLSASRRYWKPCRKH